jgi:hypothetical protein
MIRDVGDVEAQGPTAKARGLAVQFRDWLSRSLDDRTLAFDDAGVLALYTLIRMRREEILALGGEETGRWVVGMGAFLGECIRARFGGSYDEPGAEGLVLEVREGVTLYPIRWVHANLVHGEKDSLLKRYEALVTALAGGGGKETRGRGDAGTRGPRGR